MIKTNSTQAKNLIQSCKDSAWIFSTLTVLAETGGLTALKEEISLSALEKTTQIPLEILENAISLLITAEMITRNKDHYTLSPTMHALIKEDGVDNLIAQLRLIFGTNREFVLDAREHKLRQGWHHTDASILQSIGRLSQFVANEFVPKNPKLQKILEQPGARFLDIGTGTANIAIRLCEIYPNLCVVGIDPAEKPFELAQKNVAHTTFQDRIKLQKISLEGITDKNYFDVIWIPQAFLSTEILQAGLMVAWQALKPGGMLLSAALEPKEDLSSRVTHLISAIYGSARSTQTFLILLEQANFSDNKVFSEVYGYQVITATKPS